MLDIKLRVDKIVEVIEGKKAQDIKVYNMINKTPYYDYSIICTGSSSRNVLAILDAVKSEIDIIKSIEGHNEGEWVLVDGGDIIINIFTKDAREYYQLDELYGEI
ncbi:ribosome silencing factor [Oceanivirga salmonicida]|uniref:ribosome silencing factor n=1 Tax=Oceanivirga salmonicida TaxID=1769291 RepID=UPI0008323315|nr:ribosome silencing factor [Oceanivirga salmonicida]